VCGKGVGANSIMCETCNKWVHARCSKVRGPLKAIQHFQCATCTAGPKLPTTDEVVVGKDKFEQVQQFCYLGNILETSGGTEATVRARVRCAWTNWKTLSPIYTPEGPIVAHEGMDVRGSSSKRIIIRR
jgi:hypothetical protein